MLIPLWFRRRLVFAPEFFFGRSGCFPIVSFGRSSSRLSDRAELCLCRGSADRMPLFRFRMLVRVCCLRRNVQRSRFYRSVCFSDPDLYGTPPLRVVRFPGKRDFLQRELRKLYFEGCGDAESVVKIKSEKTHGSFPISLYDCSQSADFSRIIRESAPSPTAWADRDGSARLHRCPACGSSR